MARRLPTRVASVPRPARLARRVTHHAITFTVTVMMALAMAHTAAAEELARGTVLANVECLDAPAQHYALYLPSTFTPDRSWPVILIFDAAARGREGVERYQAAAERYGYIVAGSNNSRNGPWEPSLEAANAMRADVAKRFPVDTKRIYTAGMSGGARVALMVALGSESIAGVLASSAAYADTFHESLRFPLFVSAGTEDFNYREVHAVDLRMKTAHRVELFAGGHTWLPPDLATEGVEWMEVHAMKRGLRSRDDRLLDEFFARRMARTETMSALMKMRALKLVAADFEGLRDVSSVAAAAIDMEKLSAVTDALRAEREDDQLEWQTSNELNRLMRQLGWPERQKEAFQEVKARVDALSLTANAGDDSPGRRRARRALANLRAASRDIPHDEFKALMRQTPLP